MSRTILPPWSEYRKTLGVEQPEPTETFDWVLDTTFKNDLQCAKEGIDKLEGSREFLKSYVNPLEMKSNPMFNNIRCLMGEHHSGASCELVLNTYIYLLKNWDEFVLATKNREQRKASKYDERQIHYSDQDDFLAANGPGLADICSNFREKFGVSYDNETLAQLIHAIKKEENKEGMEKMKRQEERDIENDVGLLTFLYRCPIRWFSYHGGIEPFTLRNVSTPHIIKMIALYPDYMEHYTAVLKAMAEWGQMKNGLKKPTAAFFQVFKAPEMSQEKRYELSRTYPDYEEHIKSITESRDAQLQRDVLGVMFA